MQTSQSGRSLQVSLHILPFGCRPSRFNHNFPNAAHYIQSFLAQCRLGSLCSTLASPALELGIGRCGTSRRSITVCPMSCRIPERVLSLNIPVKVFPIKVNWQAADLRDFHVLLHWNRSTHKPSESIRSQSQTLSTLLMCRILCSLTFSQMGVGVMGPFSAPSLWAATFRFLASQLYFK